MLDVCHAVPSNFKKAAGKVLAKKEVPEGLAGIPMPLLFFLCYMASMTTMIVLDSRWPAVNILKA